MSIKQITSLAAAMSVMGENSNSFFDEQASKPYKRKNSGKDRSKVKAARKQNRKQKK